MSKHLSLFDGVPLNDKAFPLSEQHRIKDMTVISSCPSCGAPVYGYSSIPAGKEGTIKIRFSCDCHEKRTLQDLSRTT